MDTLAWVSLSYATYGLVIGGGTVREAPPIARWATGKDAGEVLGYLRRRGARVVLMPL